MEGGRVGKKEGQNSNSPGFLNSREKACAHDIIHCIGAVG